MKEFNFVRDEQSVLYHDELAEIRAFLDAGKEPPAFELAGPREKIYFDPTNLRCGIVTCGGLCPGLNDVIRALALSLHYHYGVKTILGFQFGYEGLVPQYGHPALELTPERVNRIHGAGWHHSWFLAGKPKCGSDDRYFGADDIGILFAIGGDGTLRGVHAIAEGVKGRGLKISVIGVPKTIDNDISYIQTSFGFETAVSEARRATNAAHVEAIGAKNGVGLVKLMGRDSGFIAGYSALADTDVNFCLDTGESLHTRRSDIGVESTARAARPCGHRRGRRRWQELMQASSECDASGNVRYGDIGIFLRDRIKQQFKAIEMEVNLKYIDPSYTIRSLPANARDAAFCLLLGHSAAHAGWPAKPTWWSVIGRTGLPTCQYRLPSPRERKLIPMGFSGTVFWLPQASRERWNKNGPTDLQAI
jgi:6-phosphofructokinase 1